MAQMTGFFYPCRRLGLGSWLWALAWSSPVVGTEDLTNGWELSLPVLTLSHSLPSCPLPHPSLPFFPSQNKIKLLAIVWNNSKKLMECGIKRKIYFAKIFEIHAKGSSKRSWKMYIMKKLCINFKVLHQSNLLIPFTINFLKSLISDMRWNRMWHK